MNNRKEIRNRLGINIDEIVIGHVGRFSAQKNQCYFIQLAEALPEKYRFLFLGDGEDKEIFLSKVQSNGLEKKFIVLPSSNEVEKYYSAMDIFIMPSIYEGLPIVAVEAQTNGLSCIFSLEVSRQADLSEHCKFLGLDGIETWVTEIRDTENLRYDGVAEIKKRKFDIESTVTCLNEIFNSSNNTNN
jgi:glycosyltransferase involved in cell wall biosynthesis